MDKVTLKDLRAIPAGEEITYHMEHPKAIDSVRTMAYRLNTFEPELKKRFSCKSDFANCTVTIRAEEV